MELVSDSIPCAVRERLFKAVAIAKQSVYQAKAEADAAIRQKRDPVSELREIATARAVERQAVADLDRHKTEHGC